MAAAKPKPLITEATFMYCSLLLLFLLTSWEMAASVEEEGMEPGKSRLSSQVISCVILSTTGMARSDWSPTSLRLTRVWQYNRRLLPGIHSLRMLLCWLCSFQQHKLHYTPWGWLSFWNYLGVWILCLVVFNIGTLPLILCVTFTFILEAVCISCYESQWNVYTVFD